MTEDMFVKQTLKKLLVVPSITHALSYVTKTHATIFMLHRSSIPDLGISGVDPDALRRNLGYLRKARYNIMSLEELFSRVREGAPLRRAIAFTIDDGYFDQAEIAAPIFAEFDCPVTCFVTTGFLDGTTWFWWDRLMYIFEETKKRVLTVRVGEDEFEYRWDSAPARRKAWWDLNVRCQDASEENRQRCIDELSRSAEVELPAVAPARFAPMSWDTARRLESRGVGLGPHTVTHPVLSTTSSAQAEWEITESWQRLSAEVSRPVPVFCYPNGRSQDVGERDISVVQRLGLWGGLMAHAGHIDLATLRDSEPARFRIPRSGFGDDLTRVLQSLSGLEALRAA
jgi:peptidoglycan/xylan/chitin deacetylase (PgdA/CDA1 family)